MSGCKKFVQKYPTHFCSVVCSPFRVSTRFGFHLFVSCPSAPPYRSAVQFAPRGSENGRLWLANYSCISDCINLYASSDSDVFFFLYSLRQTRLCFLSSVFFGTDRDANWGRIILRVGFEYAVHAHRCRRGAEHSRTPKQNPVRGITGLSRSAAYSENAIHMSNGWLEGFTRYQFFSLPFCAYRPTKMIQSFGKCFPLIFREWVGIVYEFLRIRVKPVVVWPPFRFRKIVRFRSWYENCDSQSRFRMASRVHRGCVKEICGRRARAVARADPTPTSRGLKFLIFSCYWCGSESNIQISEIREEKRSPKNYNGDHRRRRI